MGLERSMREAEDGAGLPDPGRASTTSMRTPTRSGNFEVFRDVIFDLNGQYHVAVPLNIPKGADDYEACSAGASPGEFVLRARRQGHPVAAHELPACLVVQRQLKRRGSKFVECYGNRRPARFKRGWEAVPGPYGRRTAHFDKPRVQGLPLQEGRLARADPGCRDGRARIAEPRKIRRAGDYSPGAAGFRGRTAMVLPLDASAGRGLETVPKPTAITTRTRPSAAISSATRKPELEAKRRGAPSARQRTRVPWSSERL